MSLMEKIEERNRQASVKEAAPIDYDQENTYLQKGQKPPLQNTDPPDHAGITSHHMDSKVLGYVVPMAWSKDGRTIFVDGVSYTEKEVSRLVARCPDPETMRDIHNVKRTFEGTITI